MEATFPSLSQSALTPPGPLQCWKNKIRPNHPRHQDSRPTLSEIDIQIFGGRGKSFVAEQQTATSSGSELLIKYLAGPGPDYVLINTDSIVMND